MRPEIWGRHVWNCIHIITLEYPLEPTPEEKKYYKKFFHGLSHVLPCEKCRNNMSVHLKKIPLTDEVLSSRSSLVKWGIDLHNIVNYYTGKEMLTYNEALNQINKLLESENTQYGLKQYNWLFIILLVIFLLCIYIWCIYRKN